MTPQAGDYFLQRSNGWAGRIIRWGTRSPWNHAGVCVGDGHTVEAAPKGAAIGKVRGGLVWSHFDLDEQQRQHIASAALGLIGTPYGWWDIVAISLGTLGVTLGPIGKRISDNGTLICSQLVDVAYERAGIHLFQDHRLPGQVTPGDLGKLAGFTRGTT